MKEAADTNTAGGRSDPDGLNRYVRSWNGRLLTHREELELARRRDRGDRTAVDRLVEHNLRLVYSIARRYMHAAARQGIPLDDLIQEGTLGLIRAAEKFDWRKGFKFSTYATWWIRQAVERSFANDRTMRVPTHAHERLRRMQRTTDKLSAALGRDPTVAELAGALKLPEEQVRMLQELEKPMLSLAYPAGDDDGCTIGDLLVDDSDPVEEQVETADVERLVRRMLARLTPRERFVLERRYGLNGHPEMTLEEIARSLAVSRQRVKQIEERALEALRRRFGVNLAA